MPRSESEKYCKDAFEQFLCNVLHLNDFKIEEGEDPPDYWLLHKGKRYTVEVTQIFDSIKGGSKMIPRLTYFDHEKRLAQDIEREARVEGFLRGRHYIGFEGGYPRYDPVKDRKKILNDAIQYIRDNAATEHAEKRVLFQDGRARIVISKSTNDEDYVGPGIMGVRGGWQVELVEEVGKALNDAITIKQTKLESISQSCDGVFLLIQNRHVPVEPSDIPQLLSHLSALTKGVIDGVFLIQNDKQVLKLANSIAFKTSLNSCNNNSDTKENGSQEGGIQRDEQKQFE